MKQMGCDIIAGAGIIENDGGDEIGTGDRLIKNGDARYMQRAQSAKVGIVEGFITFLEDDTAGYGIFFHHIDILANDSGFTFGIAEGDIILILAQRFFD